MLEIITRYFHTLGIAKIENKIVEIKKINILKQYGNSKQKINYELKIYTI